MKVPSGRQMGGLATDWRLVLRFHLFGHIIITLWKDMEFQKTLTRYDTKIMLAMSQFWDKWEFGFYLLIITAETPIVLSEISGVRARVGQWRQHVGCGRSSCSADRLNLRRLTAAFCTTAGCLLAFWIPLNRHKSNNGRRVQHPSTPPGRRVPGKKRKR